MRNRMYGGVRGRKAKVGRKLLRFPPTRLFCGRGFLHGQKIIFVFGRQGLGKKEAGDGEGTASEQLAADLGKSGTGGQQIVEQQDVAATDGDSVKMEIAGLVLVMLPLVLFPVTGNGDGVVTVGDAQQAGKLNAEIPEAELVPFVGGCGDYHKGEVGTAAGEFGSACKGYRHEVGHTV